MLPRGKIKTEWTYLCFNKASNYITLTETNEHLSILCWNMQNLFQFSVHLQKLSKQTSQTFGS